jgi:hypothetical protein
MVDYYITTDWLIISHGVIRQKREAGGWRLSILVANAASNQLLLPVSFTFSSLRCLRLALIRGSGGGDEAGDQQRRTGLPFLAAPKVLLCLPNCHCSSFNRWPPVAGQSVIRFALLFISNSSSSQQCCCRRHPPSSSSRPVGAFVVPRQTPIPTQLRPSSSSFPTADGQSATTGPSSQGAPPPALRHHR